MRQLIQLFGQLLAPTAHRFYRALDNPQLTQASVQKDICDRLIQSEYGKSLGIRSVADWQRVPIVDYEALAPWILGEQNQHPKRDRIPLTPEPILFYEKTSGSSGAVKWIPYTRSLRKSFNQMFCVWANDLIQHGPQFSTGKLYACISPQLDEANTKKDSSLSLQDDLDYLDGWLQWFLRPWLVMPDKLDRLRDPHLFKHQLALALLQAQKLEIISVWSPSFLQVHLNYIQANQKLLAKELQHKISRDRLQILAETKIPWTQLWSNLKLISCWDSANAADGANGLRSQFPGVLVQGKGLLATEAPMTIPLIEAEGYVPVLDRVFFEFEDDKGCLHKLHELSTGQTYTIILSQKGGLYRYRIGDRIQVTHWYRHTPCLEFLGRHQNISDLVGEKLQETFVRHILEGLNLEGTSFKSLVPVANPPHYILLLDSAKETPDILAQHLDRALSESSQYHRARLLDQLAPPQVLISPKIPEVLALYRVRTGSIWGGIKHPILVTSPINVALLQAYFSSPSP
ncbi:GH3 auxin-responsive promoter family protein [Planktothrix sp. FACHB-1355]|uniref:GH3 auxin-responsive promoter family protein n=1 Tax=Aerosakkonema funiforme FACHB-1375 TaxID=2949571 RepID=A0A926ZHE9_9CYAN|nr:MULTISPECIES: GH3 auxin-responsive promoter family protein [Oscillatoriales]MBD2183203.1 GH3 auxin-responsive promoter family protein [Aerosakkonema funiforme FACHB-1375]MBD3558948.1 GH3 auxin-responsive promoter family protein [Planktothrix sp. FACHB-1355]